MNLFRMILLFITITMITGCSGIRFVINAVPADDSLIETTVYEGKSSGIFSGTSNKIALIDVSGVIRNEDRNQYISDGENPVALFDEALERAKNDSAVKAVIIRLNSPGGSVTASDVMYSRVLSFKELTGKPVIMLMEDVAASGAYYIACAGDVVIAHPTTVTGSIGVIMMTFNFSEGMNRIGIHADAITSGSNKAMGSPFQAASAEHRAIMQEMVDEFYVRFRSIVSERWPDVDEASFDLATDGRVLSGARAADLGFVNDVGDLDDAFLSAKNLAGIPGARLVKYHRPLKHVGSPYASSPVSTGSQVNLLQLNIPGSIGCDQPGFYYLWDPAAWSITN